MWALYGLRFFIVIPLQMKIAVMGIEPLCSFAQTCFLEQCSLCKAKPYGKISIDGQHSWAPSIADPPHFCPFP